MDIEPQDEILKEFDVSLNKDESGQLYLFQYPLQSSSLNISKARVKPDNKIFEIEVLESRSYEKKKKMDVGDGLGVSTFGERLDKQVFQSVSIQPKVSYAVALVRDAEVHLTPINGVIQFRPNFKYLDAAGDSARKAMAAKEDTSSQSESEAPEERESAKAVTMRFAGPHEEKMKKAREKSYAHHQQKHDAENWTEIQHHAIASSHSNSVRTSLVCTANADPKEDSSTINISSVEEYLKSLTCNAVSRDTNGALTLEQIRNLPLADQIRKVMINANVMSFDDVMSILPPDSDSASVIRSLQQVAMLVQGNWVVKSEILYPKENSALISPVSGICIDSLSRARDYVTWLFTQNTSLMRKELIDLVKIPQDDVMMILKQMAIFNQESRSWDFSLPCDDEFIQKNSEVVQRQKMLWDARHSQIERSFTASTTVVKSEPTSPKKSPSKSPSKSPTKSTTRKRGRSNK